MHSLYGNRFGIDKSSPIMYVDGLPMIPNYATPGGKTWFVDSAVDGGAGTNPSTALGTLDEAFAKCVANKGHIVVVMPNHAETVTGVAGIAADVAGVTVIGLGSGNQRPRFLMDGATTVTCAISAADVTFSNLVFAGGHDGIVVGIDVTGVGCWLDRVEFEDNTTAEHFLTPVKATGADNTADRLKITNCKWASIDVGSLEFLEVTGDIAHLTMLDNYVETLGTASPLFLQAGSKNMIHVDVGRNYLQNAMTAGDLAFNTGGAACSGMLYDNYVKHLDVTTTHVLGAVALAGFFNNLSASTSAVSGVVIPDADVNS